MNDIISLFPNIKKFNFINEIKIFNEIQNNKKILIFDLREKVQFLNMSLSNSLNIPFDEKEDEFFKNFIENISPDLSKDIVIKELLCKFRRFYIAIIFSDQKYHRKDIINYKYQELKSHNSLFKALNLYHSLSSNKVREIGIYLKGFYQIYCKYFFIVKKNLNEPILA